VIATTQNRIGHTIASTILPTTEKTWLELYESCVTCGSFNRWEMPY